KGTALILFLIESKSLCRDSPGGPVVKTLCSQYTLCMVCKNFKKGQCLQGKGNCTMEQGPGCRTRDFFLFSEKGRWNFNHTELDCYDFCMSSNYYIGDLKISSFCCKGRDFCNKYIGKGKE
uniref:Uncharacterized protein n=1 Tax=Bos mutus grunniens TaxID=30521 RepID=A0A8C0AHE9_BOSMU